ncbi:MAG: carboxylating nicotinate-nucleotide diphosphorylase [Cyanobacteria bacterium]|nr:carboxylating nicotinate-nucleotide diphosphorylase [Cyanobacteria bacterium CG_2015-16_32_12]NCO77347.1 carboxylating nicotinate-nucleotide diphosphorylase [Cyanobacteria bacterium CG_2015-22_32_23]NCQ04128.1 carboxylating nicotinate-nucleotide diphosphorylase [Cyanobacteria bacterium CG_2015-09_32_10]NCQ42545.1 carboxylating nicotinate-nucleotide diphosphorylase [Cyanobacteria bacterium CG_2015-04_32_10]NCS83883.1 carboxylating nicotinate-nucleotide diphosphorylase [Cyanobacteria bacterium
MIKIPLPSPLILDNLLRDWLLEDIGRGDRTTDCIFPEDSQKGKAYWLIKEEGVMAGLSIAERVFKLLDNQIKWHNLASEGEKLPKNTKIMEIEGKISALLTGERVALNLVMRLSGIATMAKKYVEAIEDYPAKLVDTRKTTPGLRILEKYASQVGGAINHRLGLDDAVMIKDNHIQGAGGISQAVKLIRQTMPYPLTIEVETTNLKEVKEAIANQIEIIMLDNMDIKTMRKAVELIRKENPLIKIEASGNVTLENIQEIAATGVDYISTSATITRSPWLDISMRFD